MASFLSQIKYFFLEFLRRSGKFKKVEQTPRERLLVLQGLKQHIQLCMKHLKLLLT